MKTVTVKQVRSTIRQHKRHGRTLRALGLGRIGKTADHTLTPATQGMIESVLHLVVVTSK